MPAPMVPAMALPAMPASATSLSVLLELDSAAAVAAPGGNVGRVIAIGRTAGVAMVQPGGTDSAPTLFASPRPANGLFVDGMLPTFRFSSGAGNGLTGAGPSPGHCCSPFHPLTILSVCVPGRA